MTITMTKGLAGFLVAGWLAQQLARPDRDVERGIEAYEAREFDAALAAFDAAIARRGERPELSFDRGLVLLAQDDREGAKSAFERASESEDGAIRASAHYELGNLAFDASEWDGAIDHYIETLKASPDHGNAKWNLELALERKRAEEQEQEDEDKDKEEQEDGDQEDENDQNEEEQEDKDDQEENDSEGDQNEQEEKGDEDEPTPDDPAKGDDAAEKTPPEEEQPPKPDAPSEEENEGEDEKPTSAAPQALDQMDIDKALDQLDQQDGFMLDRPRGGFAAPERDW